MITPAIAGLDQFERLSGDSGTLPNKEIGKIFQKIPSGRCAQASPDLNRIEESLRVTSEAEPAEGVAQ